MSEMELNKIVGIVFGVLLVASAIVAKIMDIRSKKKDKKNKRF